MQYRDNYHCCCPFNHHLLHFLFEVYAFFPPLRLSVYSPNSCCLDSTNSMTLFSWFLPAPFGSHTDLSFIYPFTGLVMVIQQYSQYKCVMIFIYLFIFIFFLSGVQTILKRVRESEEIRQTWSSSCRQCCLEKMHNFVVKLYNLGTSALWQMCWCLVPFSHWSRGCNQAFHTFSVFLLLTAVVQQGFCVPADIYILAFFLFSSEWHGGQRRAAITG